ncbi:M18 family aminopeptidase [Endozoicomonas euniceicola]|uniref:M18 family aminopeptidase n=1 Tax=Endozoicomonas euniceicola TaxID=1234143 RepID=A0ABY6GRN4_9GAMM|nr:M18 family aminopeptidase [Endozoicomonas euniceicola]UYM15413.1 M18 family aminopeptidase [Endozoicomonas euniceicola]
MSQVSTLQQNFNQNLLEFLRESPTPYHAVKNMVARLEQHGFQQLHESEAWQLKDNGRYYVTRNDSSIVAFTNGDHQQGFRMVGGHTDFPCLKVKPQPELHKHQYLQLAVEVYGGALLNPWFDRDLSIAGRVFYLDTAGALKSSLINYRKAIAYIPSLAIHLDREANKNRSINPQTDIPPILCQLDKNEKADFRALLKEQLAAEGVTNVQEVLEYDLSFYDTQGAAIIGLKDEFIVSTALDNLLSCYVGMTAMIESLENSTAPMVLVCNDHEECGSKSATGAQGPMLKTILHRIAGSTEALARAISQSMIISADNAHGVHPNFADRHEGNHQPLLNKGAVLKINANQRYASNDETCSLFGMLCREAGADYQYFVTRTDLACGSTIGPLTAGELGIRTLDIGLPTFGMHSIRETAGTRDAFQLTRVLQRFFAKNRLPFA